MFKYTLLVVVSRCNCMGLLVTRATKAKRNKEKAAPFLERLSITINIDIFSMASQYQLITSFLTRHCYY